jgi:hypothetical protein
LGEGGWSRYEPEVEGGGAALLSSSSATGKSLNLGDEILAVNGELLFGLSHRQVVSKLKNAGPSVVLLVRPNQTLQDIFSNTSSTYPEKSLSSSTPSVRGDSVPAAVSPLPQGWGQKTDRKSGRAYFEK